MRAAHTLGRIWLNAEHSAIVHSDDGRIACPPNHSQRWAWNENARRLAACWNACDGINTELLERHPAPFSELRAQRDDLFAALVRLVRQHGSDGIEYSGDHPIAVARAAIGKATGATQ